MTLVFVVVLVQVVGVALMIMVVQRGQGSGSPRQGSKGGTATSLPGDVVQAEAAFERVSDGPGWQVPRDVLHEVDGMAEALQVLRGREFSRSEVLREMFAEGFAIVNLRVRDEVARKATLRIRKNIADQMRNMCDGHSAEELVDDYIARNKPNELITRGCLLDVANEVAGPMARERGSGSDT